MKPRALSLSVLALSLASLSTSALAEEAAAPDVTRAQIAQQAQNFVVYFGLDKASLDSKARATIAAATLEYRRTGAASLSVRGHADTSGNAEHNQALSQRREQAVTDELVRLGVPATAISTEALGETDLAVKTGDGVAEPENRRVVIAVAQPPAPAPAPAPEPAAPIAAAPEPALAPADKRYAVSIGPFYGYSIKDEDGSGSNLAGLNLSLDYAVLPWLGVGVEQAGFYHFSSSDDGMGGRSAASLDLLLGDLMGNKDLQAHVGGNVGYLYGDGLDDDGFAGPEVGITSGPFVAKVAYDMPFNRGADEGIVVTTIGFAFDF